MVMPSTVQITTTTKSDGAPVIYCRQQTQPGPRLSTVATCSPVVAAVVAAAAAEATVAVVVVVAVVICHSVSVNTRRDRPGKARGVVEKR